ncbi:MAG: ATP-binding protein [Candidatus Gracilibacteria bacterium]|jgi:anti-sigma regulatory factor (Ser/Thr protein kinase)
MDNTEKEIKITITLPTNAYFVSGIRDFTLNLVKNTTNFEEKWAYRFQSVIDELCNNAIEYGSAEGSDIRVIFLHKKDDYLKISVEDTGTGKNKVTAAQLQKILDERRAPGYAFTGIRGRGLVKIVGEWSDELKLEDRPEGGLKITITKYMKDSRKKDEGIAQSEQSEKKSQPITLNI